VSVEGAERIPVPFLIRPENIVRYEDGAVLILDRRAYPFERSFVRCDTYEDVAMAIEAMVTQSLGPGPTAGYGMAQAARATRDRAATEQAAALRAAAARLIATRPTNNHIRLVVTEMLTRGLDAVDAPVDAEAAILHAMDRFWIRHEAASRAVGRAGAALISEGDTILTHCWADAPFIHVLREARLAGRTFQVVCTETRPYLQGARLTADAVAELGVATTLITDAMPATLMARGRISTFIAGADRVTMDGHWINKVGTLSIAIAALRFGIPAYGVTYAPDPDAPDPSVVVIEERDPDEVLHVRGIRTATEGATGYYPAFDVTPPDLVTGFILDRGVFAPDGLADYFAKDAGGEGTRQSAHSLVGISMPGPGTVRRS
jgi:methylthioribose-1-phosphate isomerase